MATPLYININASSIESALVVSPTNMSPVAFPELVIGDSRAYNLFLVDGSGGYAPISGNGAYIPNIAIGQCGYPTGGTFKLTFSSQTTAALAWNITPAALQTALQGLSSIGSGNCTVAGVAGQYYLVTFTGSLGGSTQPQITSDFSGLLPDSTIDVSTIVTGGSGMNCQQLLTFAINPISFSNSWTPITNGWTGTLSTRTLDIIEAFAASGGTLSETFQVTIADPSGNRLTYCKVPATIQCTIVNPESFAGTDKPLLATQAALNAAVLGLNNFTRESLSSTAVGNTNITPTTTSRHHTAIVAVSGAVSTRTLSILTSNSPNAGDTVLVAVFPNSTSGNIVQVRNATSGGTLLDTFTTDTNSTPYFGIFGYTGSAWALEFSTANLLTTTGNLAGLNNTLSAKLNLRTLFNSVSPQSSNFIVSAANEGTFYAVSASGGAVVATIPSAATAGNGFLLAIQKSDSSANTVTTSPATVTLANNNQVVLLLSDGTNWNVVNNFIPVGSNASIVLGSLILNGSTSGSVTLLSAASGPGATITLPQGTTDFSATGGTGKFVKQAAAGAAFTVVQPATTDLSDAANVALLNGPLVSSSASGGVGYSTGSGGTVTQVTNKSTGVTLNKVNGDITMSNALLANATAVTFVLTNSQIAANDGVQVTMHAGGTSGGYLFSTNVTGAGSASITVYNCSGGSLAEAIVLHFTVLKGAIS